MRERERERGGGERERERVLGHWSALVIAHFFLPVICETSPSRAVSESPHSPSYPTGHSGEKKMRKEIRVVCILLILI